MKRRLSRKVKIILCTAAVFLVIAGSLAYAAADRFLIEHVETHVSQTASETDVQSGTASASVSSEDSAVTDTSYESATKKISVKKVTTGSGSDQVVYYVADVQLKNATDLKSALAKNEFGTNIIQYVSEMAESNNAILAIDGDYYGFRSDGIVIRDGVLYRDSPARKGLALYKDGSMKVYDETSTTGEALLAGGVYNTLSFGPTLLKDGEIVSGIDSTEADTNFGNHSIQGDQPRTGIGIVSENHFVFVVADGGSSEMVFMGKIVNTPSNRNGSERGTSDILYIP